jgi:hypothetical protein
LTDVGSAN